MYNVYILATASLEESKLAIFYKKSIWLFVARFRKENEAIDKANRLCTETKTKVIVKRCAKIGKIYIHEIDLNIDSETKVIQYA